MAMSCARSEGLEEPYTSLIPSCGEKAYTYRLASENVDRSEVLNLARETSQESSEPDGASSWTRVCEGTDLSVTMTVLQFRDVRAAEAYVDDRAESYGEFGAKTGNQVVDVSDDARQRLRIHVDALEAFEYGSWPYLADGPTVAERDGFGERDGVAGFRLFAREERYVLEYGAQHNRVEVLVVSTGDWFALPPSGTADFVLNLASRTLANWPP